MNINGYNIMLYKLVLKPHTKHNYGQSRTQCKEQNAKMNIHPLM